MSEVRAYAKDGFEYGNDSEAVLIFKALGNNESELSEDDLKSGVVTIHDNLLNDPEATIAYVDQGAIVNLRAAIVKNIELAKTGEGINPDYCLAGYGIREDETREESEAGIEGDGAADSTEAAGDVTNTEAETKTEETTPAGDGGEATAAADSEAGDNTPAAAGDGEAAA